jgi:hypothetical protein
MEDLITHAPLLFDDGSTPTFHEPPLPPAPSGEPKPKYDYGSSYTRSHTIPPRMQDEQDDFSPTLPPRPGQSIHPSRRPQSLRPDMFEPRPVSSPPSQQSVEAPPSDSVSHDVDMDVTSVSTSATTSQDDEMLKLEVEEEVSNDQDKKVWTDNAEVPSPRTPDTFVSAESAPGDSPRSGKASKPPSRPSTARST